MITKARHLGPIGLILVLLSVLLLPMATTLNRSQLYDLVSLPRGRHSPTRPALPPRALGQHENLELGPEERGSQQQEEEILLSTPIGAPPEFPDRYEAVLDRAPMALTTAPTSWPAPVITGKPPLTPEKARGVVLSIPAAAENLDRTSRFAEEWLAEWEGFEPSIRV